MYLIKSIFLNLFRFHYKQFHQDCDEKGDL